MRAITYRALLIAAALLWLPPAATATTYKVDPSHTSVSFRIRHLFTQVEGRFTAFSGTIEFEPDAPAKTRVSGEIDASSIDTNNQKRDKHLRSSDFFNVETYPKITFASTSASGIDVAGKKGKLHGELSMHGVKKSVTLDVEYLGSGTDPWGNRRGGFSAHTTLNRKDFGLNWNEALETGGFLVGDEVEIRLSVEGLVE